MLFSLFTLVRRFCLGVRRPDLSRRIAKQLTLLFTLWTASARMIGSALHVCETSCTYYTSCCCLSIHVEFNGF